MKILSGNEEIKAKEYFLKAAEIAKNATCERSKCWCVIVKDWEIIWIWFNSPVKWLESQRRCNNNKELYNKKVTDKTCCIHAEQRAIIDALKNNGDKIDGSHLYFIRLNKEWEMSRSWEPYCTICSKLALETGVKYFYLRHENWITQYNTEEYNLLSYKFNW